MWVKSRIAVRKVKKLLFPVCYYVSSQEKRFQNWASFWSKLYRKNSYYTFMWYRRKKRMIAKFLETENKVLLSLSMWNDSRSFSNLLFIVIEYSCIFRICSCFAIESIKNSLKDYKQNQPINCTNISLVCDTKTSQLQKTG